jgi:hypothetical protein
VVDTLEHAVGERAPANAIARAKKKEAKRAAGAGKRKGVL